MCYWLLTLRRLGQWQDRPLRELMWRLEMDSVAGPSSEGVNVEAGDGLSGRTLL